MNSKIINYGNTRRWGNFFLGVISLGRVVEHSPKIVTNLPRKYGKLHCKGEPYRFSVQREPLVHTGRHHL